MVLLLGEIDCSKYFVKCVSQKFISVQDCAILHNLKCEFKSVIENNYLNIISRTVITTVVVTTILRFWMKLIFM